MSNNGIKVIKSDFFKHYLDMRNLFISVCHNDDNVQDIVNKRNPRLVPYNLLDEKTKKTNRDTVCAAVRTLIGYGYNIEPPDQESSEYS